MEGMVVSKRYGRYEDMQAVWK
ncbi:unnamed protein product, partial [Didymodactylos carnosus]